MGDDRPPNWFSQWTATLFDPFVMLKKLDDLSDYVDKLEAYSSIIGEEVGRVRAELSVMRG